MRKLSLAMVLLVLLIGAASVVFAQGGHEGPCSMMPGPMKGPMDNRGMMGGGMMQMCPMGKDMMNMPKSDKTTTDSADKMQKK